MMRTRPASRSGPAWPPAIGAVPARATRRCRAGRAPAPRDRRRRGAGPCRREHGRGRAGGALDEAERHQGLGRGCQARRGRDEAVGRERARQQPSAVEPRAELAEEQEAERAAGHERGQHELRLHRRPAQRRGQARHRGQHQVGAGNAEHGRSHDENEGGNRLVWSAGGDAGQGGLLAARTGVARPSVRRPGYGPLSQHCPDGLGYFHQPRPDHAVDGPCACSLVIRRMISARSARGSSSTLRQANSIIASGSAPRRLAMRRRASSRFRASRLLGRVGSGCAGSGHGGLRNRVLLTEQRSRVRGLGASRFRLRCPAGL